MVIGFTSFGYAVIEKVIGKGNSPKGSFEKSFTFEDFRLWIGGWNWFPDIRLE